MRAKKRMILWLLIVALLFAMVGCSDTKTVEYITDIEGYETMQQGGDKIEVYFENGTRYGFPFTIEEQIDIDEIVNLLLSTRLEKLGDGPVAPGDNTHFTVYQGDKAYGIALSGVTSNGDRYGFTSNDLRKKISEIAAAKGAFDTEAGSIRQVIDL